MKSVRPQGSPMDKMQRLALEVKALEEKIADCTRCGMCQAQCPLFLQTNREADVSRGKLALIQGLIDNFFKDAKGVAQRLDRCLLCGACAKACPSGVDTIDIFLTARAVIAKYLSLPFSQKVFFKKILADPRRFNLVMGMAAAFQPLFFRKQNTVPGTSCARAASPLLKNRHVVPLASPSFHAGLSRKDYRHRGRGVKVAFFVGCLIDKAFPAIAHDVVTVLKHFDADIFIPADQGCCGIPALAAGDTQTFARLVEANTALFGRYDFDYVVTACATCSSTIIKHWPRVMEQMEGPQKEQVAFLCERTVDISWLMTRRFRVDLENIKKDNLKVTYHDPCHLKKSLDIFDEPRRVIRAAGHELVEMERPDACCGMGGSFNLKYYDISSEIGSRKAADILKTGCRVAATSCPACMIQLSDLLAGRKAPVAVTHPVSLYARSLTK